MRERHSRSRGCYLVNNKVTQLPEAEAETFLRDFEVTVRRAAVEYCTDFLLLPRRRMILGPAAGSAAS